MSGGRDRPPGPTPEAPHPTPSELAAYLAGELDPRAAGRLGRHLATCPACRGRLPDATAPEAPAVLWRAERFARREPATNEEARRPREADEVALGSLLGSLGGALGALGRAAAGELLALSEHERRRRLKDDPRLPSEDLAVRLLARCRAAWAGDPVGAPELAKLALLVIERLDPATWSAPRLVHLRSLALEHLAWSRWIVRRAQAIEREAAALSGGFDGALAEDALAVEVEAALDDVGEHCVERGRLFDAALALFDRARLALERGGQAAMLELLEPLEAESGLDGPAAATAPAAAIMLLRGRARDGRADVALVERLGDWLADARNDFVD